nr:hypothetical protein [Tanacetum cinerariifolium]
DDDDDEEEISKIGEQEAIESDEGDDDATKSDGESEDEETREQEEESSDPIPQTPKDSKDDGNNEENQGLRIGEEERIREEEEANELYHDVDINQGRGLQVSQVIEDSHVTLTLTHSDGQQENLSTSSFVTNLLNPIIDLGMESIFTTGSSTVTPIPSPKSTMTPSIMTTTTTASQPPIPSIDLQNLPTFMSVKSQVNAQVTRILPRIEESVNTQLEAEVLTRSSHSSRTSYAVAADLSEMELKKILIEKMEGNKEDVRMMMIRKNPPLDQTGGLRDEEKEESMHQPALHLNQLPCVQASLLQPRKPPTPDCDWNKSLPTAQGNAQSRITACGRSSTRSRKLPEEAQPYKTRHVTIRSKAIRSVYCLFEPKRLYLSKQGQEKQVDADR